MSMKKAQLTSKSLLSRLGGFSIFGFGVSFKPSESDRTIVRELLTFLEDRRALYVGSVWEEPDKVVDSVQLMRTELTSALKRLGEGSPAANACRLMRAACRDFVGNVDKTALLDSSDSFSRGWQGENFLIALGALRAIFGQQIALLAHLYEVKLEQHLADILPPVPEAAGK